MKPKNNTCWYSGLYSYAIKSLFILVFLGFSVQMHGALPPVIDQQSNLVTGVVTESETGDALIGVSVSIKGTAQAVMTDIDGRYSITVSSDKDVLVFSYIGKKKTEVTVGSQRRIDIKMADDSALLGEVLITTGYMKQRKADLTGALAMASSEDLEKNPSANAMKSLQGKLPGVFITTDGNPAEDVGILIRGITSFNSAPPLIILDGQPADINLRDINSFDIETIQVLKDAASASIYGSRAASGVILIETKKGKEGKLQISYDGSVSFSWLVNKPDMLNTEQYGRALWQANVNDGLDPGTTIRIYDYDWAYDANGIPKLNSLKPIEWLNSSQTMRSGDTDWFDQITRTGVQTNHQVTISNGTDKSRSLFSLNYYNNQGTQIETYFRRYSIRMNNEYDLIKNRLKVGENFTVSYLKYLSGNETYNALITPPNIPVYAEDGNWGGAPMGLGMDDFWNPVRILKMNKSNYNKFMKLLGNAYADLQVIPGLNLRTQLGVDYSNAYFRHIDYTWREAGGKFDDINGVENDQNHTLSYTWTNTANYSLKFDKHVIDAVGGLEYIRWNNDGFNAYRDGITLEERDYALLSVASGNRRNLKGWADEWAMFSYFAKANYVYDSRYLLSATIRHDGASKFGSNNRWATFPAFSAGWRISEEKFMKNIDYLSDLKLRVSWGKNGNSQIPTTALQTYYIADYNGSAWPLSTSYPIEGNESGQLESGYRRVRLGNQDLKWETTKQTNLGVDFGFLNQRINGTFDYFYKTTSDMLYEPPYLGTFGEGGYRYINAATMTNRGVELALTYHSDHKSDFRYSVTANLSTFKHKVTKLPEGALHVYGGNGMLDNIVGRPLNSFYGLVADGIFKTQEEVDNSPEQEGKGLGRIRYKDLDGDGRIDESYDRTWIGVSDPDFIAGININAQYKDFDLTMFFQGVFGNEVYNSWKEYSDFWDITEQRGKNHMTKVLKAWSPSNPDSNIPALTTLNANKERRMSTYFIEDGSYIKLRTMELGYTFPKHITERMYMSRLRTYVSAQNLFTMKAWWSSNKFSGPDPESPGFGYLRPFTLTVGVNVVF